MSCVLFNEYPTQDGKRIVEICLNAERSLNALSLDMIDLIQPQLDQWQDDDRVVAVILDSAGSKAFCAGGDVVSIYKAISEDSNAKFAEAFFTREYTLDYTIHTYSKPIICWGSGIVMGGGMGLMNGCSHRIVTETSHLAMPEVTIGLYPDVGGSWFLNHMPGRTGLFLGLTGNPMNAADALFLGLADRFISVELRQSMLESLQAESWGDANAAVNRVLRRLEHESQACFSSDSPVRHHYDFIQQITDHDSVAGFVDSLLSVESDDKWIKRAQKAIHHGSPLAINLIKKQLEVTKHMSLKEVFCAELILSVQCCQHKEFPEGVRALLVDKDADPQWRFKTLADVDNAYVDKFFLSPWQKNPLAEM
ncbi:enoyl-CoA hydratase/isomerase family protein [Neptuniibacter sp. 2_MG-2023]|jgi:enoyl-CoA hydratase/carnithine racemase|uniref:enoyl-CoA hydratase/isomerase family protein n=1 Tax=Neptuniibacter sp. 2_MG-2023 TaxID=3062671 RepID=UPI0026E24D8D|nr:enoyl-CoA hydratase/isomerase family protein [Neptuniibacter sp. 2_MG-2023]MDO6514104.1 enoyl-CoA hydratase/isomerase family protein [Neptuniibacter sp. 2_MG-2023]